VPETDESPYAQPVPTAPPLSPAEEKQWAMLTHLISLFAGILPAIIFWVIYRDRGPFVRAHTTTEFNLQLTVAAVSVLGFVLCFVPFFTTIATTSTPQSPGMPPAFGLFFVGYFLILGVKLVAFVMGIVASVAASKGKHYRYKGVIQFVRA
jgi:uncharacterized protein